MKEKKKKAKHDTSAEAAPESVHATAKVVLLGDSAVGKSSLVARFTKGEFDEESTSTVGVAFTSKEIATEDGKTIKFQIWDTAGQEQYHSLASLYYRNAHAAVVVYDVTRRSSFEGVRNWVHELKQLGPEKAVIIVVGNKTDLANKRTVSREEAVDYAVSRGALYVETSVKLNENVASVFSSIAMQLHQTGLAHNTMHHDVDEDAATEVGRVIKLDGTTNSQGLRKGKSCCPG